MFISTSTAPPTVQDAYITAKRHTERAITDLDLRTRVLRAGPLYGKGQPHFPWIVNQGFRLFDEVDSISEQMGDARPLPVEPVARATLAATDGTKKRLVYWISRRLRSTVDSRVS